MSLFLVTGLPGSGKSTTYTELKARGYDAYDGDYDHIAKWYNTKTGQPVEKEGHYRERTPEFLATHSRDISRQAVEDLAAKAKHKTIFLCGDPENEDKLVDLFAKVFALVLNEDIRQRRLATRTNSQWGKLPHEIAYDLAIKPKAFSRYKRFGYDVINAEQPTNLIVEYIETQTGTNILGQGFGGVVVADTPTSVKKFYVSEQWWEHEKKHLGFLAEIQRQGFGIGCTIPKLIESADKRTWEVDGKTYRYCNTMELIPGVTAWSEFKGKNLETLGTNLGTVLANMHVRSASYIPQWKAEFGDEDTLLTHIFKDKAAQVLQKGTDATAKSQVKDVLEYLEKRKDLLVSERTLSHLDLNLNNILVTKDNAVEGLVDWGDFGLTHPSLSLYQLATKPALWQHIKQHYEKSGGTIRSDIVYAAATIHLAWVPVIWKEHHFELDEDETHERLQEVYRSFATNKK